MKDVPQISRGKEVQRIKSFLLSINIKWERLSFDYGNRCTVNICSSPKTYPFISIVVKVECTPSTRVRKSLDMMHDKQMHSVSNCYLAF